MNGERLSPQAQAAVRAARAAIANTPRKPARAAPTKHDPVAGETLLSEVDDVQRDLQIVRDLLTRVETLLHSIEYRVSESRVSESRVSESHVEETRVGETRANTGDSNHASPPPRDEKPDRT